MDKTLTDTVLNTASKITVKIKKLFENSKLPILQKSGDAGYDLTVARIIKKSLFKIEYGFGISMEIPEGYYVDLRPRSSIYKTKMILSNSPGTGDSGYRGEYKAIFWKLPFLSKPYKVGERAIQIIFKKYSEVTLVETDSLSSSDRGESGYGSTGNT